MKTLVPFLTWEKSGFVVMSDSIESLIIRVFDFVPVFREIAVPGH